MNTATRVAAAAASGYILGRRKRLKLAIAVGSMLAGKRLATDPRGMMRQANELIESRPELAKISDQVRTTLYTAARGAAVGVVSNRINALSDSIRDRSDRLTGAVGDKAALGRGSDDEESSEDEGTEEKDESRDSRRARRDDGDDGGDGGGGDDDAGGEEKAERTRPSKRAAKKTPAKKAPAKKAPAKKAASSGGDAPARKRTAAKKSTATKKSAAKKSAAKKTTSGRSGSGSRG